MSHPLLGNINEVSGGVITDVVISQINDSAGGKEGFEISIDESTFKIDNEYYNELFKEGLICPALKVVCKNTLLSISVDGFEKVFIGQNELDKLIIVECYLAAAESFRFNPRKGVVNDFFLGESDIEKGYVMSTKKK